MHPKYERVIKIDDLRVYERDIVNLSFEQQKELCAQIDDVSDLNWIARCCRSDQLKIHIENLLDRLL